VGRGVKPGKTGKQPNTSAKSGSVKQFVWDLLKRKGAMTRNDLVAAIRKAGLSEHKDDEQIRAYLGVVIHHLKTKNGVEFLKTPQGVYEIAKR